MTELALHQSTDLSIVPDQSTFTPAQRTALSHIGVENATDADIEVFFHVVKRTGLDPFARQIYMIGRNSKVWNPRTKQESWVTKFTIQTGIDGYRLIGRRAANAAGATLSVKPVQWAHEDGGWRDVWISKWGQPVAARVTIMRSGEEFTATALFDEYKQTTKDGTLTQMWRQRPAGQIGKCAEALAWRMAFPQDLSGIYVDEEMQQADAAPRAPRTQDTSSKQQVQAAIAGKVNTDEPEPAPVPLITKPQAKKMHAGFNDLGITDRGERMAYTSKTIGRTVESSNELTKVEAGQVIEAVEADVKTKTETVKPEDLTPEQVEESNALRDNILIDAEEIGRTLADVEAAFAEQHEGLTYYDASLEQLQAFHEWVKGQKAAA